MRANASRRPGNAAHASAISSSACGLTSGASTIVITTPRSMPASSSRRMQSAAASFQPSAGMWSTWRWASIITESMAGEIDAILSDLLASTRASRVTLRRAVPGEYAFPVTHEALAAGVGSLREERTVDLRTQPVALEVAAGRQVVQDDCATAYDDPAFHRMREVYGGLAPQIVTPVARDGDVIGIVSLHQLGAPRNWMREQIEACRAAAARLEGLL